MRSVIQAGLNGSRRPDYCPSRLFIISSIFSLTASRLKDPGFCIGGYSSAVSANSKTSCCTRTKRQNSRA
jgi:hypothetical protein